MSGAVDFEQADKHAQMVLHVSEEKNIVPHPGSIGEAFVLVSRAYLALRTEVAAVRAEERARCVSVGTHGVGVVNVNGSASHRVFVGSDAPAFAGHHASIVNGREFARGKPWTPAEVVVIPLAALTGGPHE